MKKLIWMMIVLCLSIPLSNQVRRQEAAVLQPDIAKRVLRFHVRANSDTQKDQELKLKVRDAVGAEVTELLKESQSRTDSEQILKQHLGEIVACAEQTLRQNGCEDSVKASISDKEFPEKTYGSYTFPKGRYRALELQIGEANGHNWWCVMYPNLCFADSLYQEPGEEDAAELKKVLTPAEYDSIMKQDSTLVRCRYVTALNPLLERIFPADTGKDIK